MDEVRIVLARISEQIGHPLPDLKLEADARQYITSRTHTDEEKRTYLLDLMEQELAQLKADRDRLEKLTTFEFLRPIFGEYATTEWMPVVCSMARLRDPQTASRYHGVEKESGEFRKILEEDVKLIRDTVFQAIDRGDGKTFRDLGNILDLKPPASTTRTKEMWRRVGAVAACYLMHHLVTRECLPTKRVLKEAVEEVLGNEFSKSDWARLWKKLSLTDVLPHHSSATHGVVKVRKVSSKKRGGS